MTDVFFFPDGEFKKKHLPKIKSGHVQETVNILHRHHSLASFGSMEFINLELGRRSGIPISYKFASWWLNQPFFFLALGPSLS